MKRGNHFRHGMSHTPTHNIWTDMRSRCNNPACKNYKFYGLRGIRVCPRWDTFEHFLIDMGERPGGMSLDRRNTNGNYEPGNCRWASDKDQARNTRRNHMVTAFGRTQCIAAWEEETGISCLQRRLQLGWTAEKSLSTPSRLAGKTLITDSQGRKKWEGNGGGGHRHAAGFTTQTPSRHADR